VAADEDLDIWMVDDDVVNAMEYDSGEEEIEEEDDQSDEQEEENKMKTEEVDFE
jgi:prophage antirepressor-like protein